MASFITMPANSDGSMLASEPPNAPMAERAALKTTTSFVIKNSSDKYEKTCQIGLTQRPLIEILIFLLPVYMAMTNRAQALPLTRGNLQISK
jgi:hypothetical protein